MLIAAHSISAGVAGTFAANSLLAFLLGVFLHFVLDLIPHYDTTDGGKFTCRQIALIAADFVFGMLVVFFIIKPANFSFWGALGGIFPDLLDANPFLNKKIRQTFFGKRIHCIHAKVHKYKASALPGLLVQWVVIFCFVCLALRQAH